MQETIYNFILTTAYRLIKLLAHRSFLSRFCTKKVELFVNGQSDIREQIGGSFRSDGRPVYWFHCASLGEHGIAFPLMKRLRETEDCIIVLTFFSSTGIEAAKNRGAERMGADFVYYLPFDTRKNVRFFLDTIQPRKAIFMVSEYWIGYMNELSRRKIDTYLVSAIIRPSAVLFRWYGGIYARTLHVYKHVFVLTNASRRQLGRLHFHRSTFSGDPLFDNAIARARLPYENKIVERFCQDRQIFIAGSIHDESDLTLVSTLANNHPEQKFIFVPHETTPKAINDIKAKIVGRSISYSDCTEQTDFNDVQILIIDFVGALAQMYRYGTWAYVGGGFTRYLHSIIEPAVYGLPVAFGPRIQRKQTPRQMVERGIGEIITKIEEMERWYKRVKDPMELQRIHTTAKAFVAENEGATDTIMSTIFNQDN